MFVEGNSHHPFTTKPPIQIANWRGAETLLLDVQHSTSAFWALEFWTWERAGFLEDEIDYFETYS